MFLARLVFPLILGLLGGIWLGQGLGLIPGSSMTSEPFWAAMGAVLVALAVVLLVRIGRGTA